MIIDKWFCMALVQKNDTVVQFSLDEKIWLYHDHSVEEAALFLEKTCGLPAVTAKALACYGLKTQDEVKQFLDAKIKDLFPEPYDILDMKNAVERVVQAILNKEKVFVFGDYDVDGITAAYTVINFLRNMNVDVSYYIPNRIIDGYGINNSIVDKAQKYGAKLIIVVDSGITAVSAVKYCNQLNIDCIIIDHHMPSGDIPEALAVINANRVDQKELGKSGIKNLCAAGMSFVFITAVQRFLKNNGHDDLCAKNLTEYVAVAALGTLCDVSEMRGLNRAFLTFMMKTQSFPLGMLCLMQACGIEKITSSDDLSFIIGPAINAAGRVGTPGIAISTLLATDEQQADKLAEELMECNIKRRAMEKRIVTDVLDKIKYNNLNRNNFFFVYDSNWHDGVIGIVAGRVKDMFNKPAFVVSFDGDIGTGSVRSINEVDVSVLLEKALNNGLIITGGGHRMAGGFTISIDKVDEFYKFLQNNIKYVNDNTMMIDIELQYVECFQKLAEEISILEPFGKGVPQPVCCIKHVRLSHYNITQSGQHMLLTFNWKFSRNINCVVFNISYRQQFVEKIKNNIGKFVDIACIIKRNTKYGYSIIVQDIMVSSKQMPTLV